MVLDAGFVEVVVDDVDLVFRFDCLGDFLDWVAAQSLVVASALSEGGPELQARFDTALEREIVQWTEADGSIALPGVAHVVTAEA
jgi:hypothetical protein